MSWEHVHQGLVKKEEWAVSTFYDKNNPYTSVLRLLAASKQAGRQAGRQASRQAGKQMPRLQLPAIPCVATDNNSRLRLLVDPRGIVRLPAYVTCSRELLAHTIVKRAVTIHIASDTTYPPS